MTARTFLYETCNIRAAEFKRRIEKLARRYKLSCTWDPAHGKGSHGTLYLAGRSTTLKDLKKEIGLGLLKSMCNDLGVDPSDWTVRIEESKK